MDVLFLSRLQFAMAAMFHFLFVPLTLGLGILTAIVETRYVRTGDEEYKRMAKFWGRLFVINFVIGVVTGLTLEFQFGTNWSKYSIFVGDIFGSLLAIEATVAFFLESTFLAVWIFGWNKVSPKFHAASIWIVAIASCLSALWILLANGWMQNPVGYSEELVDGVRKTILVDFAALVTNRYGWHQFLHTIFGAFILSGFFMMGVSAWHIFRRNEVEFFKKSFRTGAYFALIFAVIEVVQGHSNGAIVAEMQPAKLAAMEALWETHNETGERTPQTLLVIPDTKNERNIVAFGEIPGALSMLAYHDFDAPVKGLDQFPREDWPPVAPTFWAFRIMVGLGFLFPALAMLGVALFLTDKTIERVPLSGPLVWLRSLFFERKRALLWIYVAAIPLPYIALQAGWITAEIGRQPWIVYGLMRTRDAVSPIDTVQVGVSLAGLFLLYAVLGAIDFYLLHKFAKRGPEALGDGAGEARGDGASDGDDAPDDGGDAGGEGAAGEEV